MPTNDDAEAIRRIRAAAAQQDRLLDLGDLRLSSTVLEALPEAGGTIKALSLGKRKWERDACGAIRLMPRSGPRSAGQLFKKGLEQLAQMPGLTHLSLDGAHLEDRDFLNSLSGLQSLEAISLCGCTNLTTLKPLAGLAGLKYIDASDCEQLTEIPPVDECHPLLESLVLNGCERLSCNIAIKNHPHIQRIEIRKTAITGVCLSHLSSLVELSCQSCGCLGEIQLAHLEKLKDLTLNDCHKLKACTLMELGSIEGLTLSGMGRLQQLSIEAMPKLAKLDCSGCLSLTEISGLEGLVTLEKLVAAKCEGLKKFAPIKHLLEAHESRLEALVLSGCKFDDLPPEFCGHGVGFMLDDNMAERIRSYYRRLESEKSSDVQRASFCRVILLGNPGAGKTTLVNNLVNDRCEWEPRSMTEGIRLVEWDRDIRFNEGAEKVFISFWDCGGQDMYHNTHRIFVKGRGSSRNVFVLVWGENDPDGRRANDGHPLDYWMNQIRALDREARVLILTNWHDTETADARKTPDEVDALLTRIEDRTYVQHYACNLMDGESHRRNRDQILKFLDDRIIQRLGRSEHRRMPAGNLAIIRQIREMKGRVGTGGMPGESRWITGELFMEWVKCHCSAGVGPLEVAEDLADYGVLFFDQTKPWEKDIMIALDLVGAIEAVYHLFNAGKGNFGRQWLNHAYFSKKSLDMELAKVAGGSEVELALIRSIVEGCGVAFPVFKTKRDKDLARDCDFLAPWRIGGGRERKPLPLPDTTEKRRCYWRSETLGVHVLHSLMRLAVSAQTEWFEPKFWHFSDDRWEVRFNGPAGSVEVVCFWMPLSSRGYGGWLELGAYGESKQAVESVFKDVEFRLVNDVSGWQEEWPRQNGPVVMLENEICCRKLVIGIAYAGSDGAECVAAIKAQWQEWGMPSKEVVDYDCAHPQRASQGPGGMRRRLAESMPTVVLLTPGYMRSRYCLIELLDFYLSSEEGLEPKIIRAFGDQMRYCLKEFIKGIAGEDLDVKLQSLFVRFLDEWSTACIDPIVQEKLGVRPEVDLKKTDWKLRLAGKVIDATLGFGDFMVMNLEDGNWRSAFGEAVTKVVNEVHTPSALKPGYFEH